MKKLGEWLFKARFLLLVLVLLSLGPAAKPLQKLGSNNTIDAFLARNDPGLTFYRQTTDTFGGDHIVYVSLEVGAGRLFTLEGLSRVDRLTRALQGVEGVEDVTSLTDTDAVIGESGMARVGPLMDELPSDEAEALRIGEKVRSSNLLQRLASADGSSTLLVVELSDASLKDPALQNRIVVSIRELLASVEQAGAFRLAGNPVIAEAIERHNSRDTALFSGLMLLLVGISGIVLTRRVGLGLLSLGVVFVGVTWTMGLFVLGGNQTNWVTSMITPLLVLVAVSDSNHIVTRFMEVLPGSGSRREAAWQAAREMFVPCFWTSFTTTLGFGSLIFNEVLPVRTFGIYTAIGNMLTFGATFVVVPAILSIGRKRKPVVQAAEPSRPRITAAERAWPYLRVIDRIVQARPRTLLLLTLAVVLPITAGTFFVRVETNLLKYFKPSEDIVQDALFIDDAYGGSSPVDIIVRTSLDDGAKDPAVLGALATLQDRLDARPGVERGISLSDLVMELNEVMSGDPTRHVVPKSQDAISQLLLLVGPETTDPMVDSDWRTLRLAVRFEGGRMGVSKARELLDSIRSDYDGLFPPGVEVTLTGSSVLFVNMDEYLVNGQIQSFGSAFLLLLVVMSILFRSFRLGLLGMVPNVIPVGILLGFMGWARIPLDGFTVMIASMAIGIGVDDTIHYMHHLKENLRADEPIAAAVTRTLRDIGLPLGFTSGVLVLGFWVFCLSDFVGTRNFGFLSGLTLLVAALVELFMTPALLLIFGVPRKWIRST